MKKLFEYSKQDLTPIDSFDIQKTLNTKVWIKSKDSKEEELVPSIRENLLAIADDYISTLAFELNYTDICLVGSLANYNYSEYSDFDLHIIADYKKINSDITLVEAYLDLHKKNWNDKYNIKILGYDVELYVQNSTEEFHSNGIYSISKNEWVKYPSKINFTIDKKEIEKKAIDIMEDVDDISKQLNQEPDYDDIENNVKKVWKKIKKYRKDGLDTKEEEYSIGNLVFKFLRRNGYIGKIIDIKKQLKEQKYGG